MPGTVKTTRLRKVQCGGCGYVARVSRTWLAVGLPGCPCGSRLVPTDLDDVMAALEAGHVVEADLDEHAEFQTFQTARGGCVATDGKRAKWGLDHYANADELAYQKVRATRDLLAHRARHEALKAHAFGGPVVPDEIPF